MNKSKDIISIIDNIRNLGIGYIDLIKNVNNDDLPDFNLLYKKSLFNKEEVISNDFITFQKLLDKNSNNHIVNLYNSYKYIINSYNTEEWKEFLLYFDNEKESLSSNIKINLVKINNIFIPIDNLILTSMYIISKSKKRNKIVSKLKKYISENEVNFNLYFDFIENLDLEFYIYDSNEEMIDFLIRPQFIKENNKLNIRYGFFSNLVNNKFLNNNINNIQDIHNFLKENQNKSNILKIIDNASELYSIAQNQSFVEKILSKNMILKSKKYLLSQKYWIKLINSIHEILPFKIPDEDKKLIINYDNNNFKIVSIKSKLINSFHTTKKTFVFDECVEMKLMNSTKIDILGITEYLIKNDLIDILELANKYELDENKFNNCSLSILNKIESNIQVPNKMLSSEITNKLIRDRVGDISKSLSKDLNLFNSNLFIFKNDELDIYSTARSLRTFIELISKIFILTQALQCYKSKNKKKYHTKIQKLSELLNVNTTIMLFNSLTNLEYDDLKNSCGLDLYKIKNITNTLHLEYHLDDFNDKFNFEIDGFNFSYDTYDNFIIIFATIFERKTLNVFSHTFPWFNNRKTIIKLMDKFVHGMLKIIKLLKTERYDKFVSELNSIYEFLSNKDKSLEKFFNTDK